MEPREYQALKSPITDDPSMPIQEPHNEFLLPQSILEILQLKIESNLPNLLNAMESEVTALL